MCETHELYKITTEISLLLMRNRWIVDNCEDSVVVKDYNIRYTENVRSSLREYRNRQKGVGSFT